MKKRRILSRLILPALIPLLLFSGCAGNGWGGTTGETGTTIAGETGTSAAADIATDTQPQTTEGSTVDGTTSPGQTNGTTGVATTKPVTTVPTTAVPDSVTLKVTCAEAAEIIKQNNIKGYESVVPTNGIMLEKTGIKLQDKDSVMSVLTRTLKENGIVYKVQSGAYVLTIKGLTAKSKPFGEQSGWLYSVNGVTPPNIGAAEYTVYDPANPAKQPVLKPGDVIEFRFVTKQAVF